MPIFQDNFIEYSDWAWDGKRRSKLGTKVEITLQITLILELSIKYTPKLGVLGPVSPKLGTKLEVRMKTVQMGKKTEDQTGFVGTPSEWV